MKKVRLKYLNDWAPYHSQESLFKKKNVFRKILLPTVRRRAIIAFSHVATRDLTRASSADREAAL